MTTFFVLMSVWAGVYGGFSGEAYYATGEGKVVAFYVTSKDCDDAKVSLQKGLGNGHVAICIRYSKEHP